MDEMIQYLLQKLQQSSEESFSFYYSNVIISLDEKISLYRDIKQLHQKLKARIHDIKSIGWFYFHHYPTNDILHLVKEIVDRELYLTQLTLMCFILYCKLLPDFASELNQQLGKTDENGFSLNAFLLDYSLPNNSYLFSSALSDDIMRELASQPAPAAHDLPAIVLLLKNEKKQILKKIELHEYYLRLFDSVQQWTTVRPIGIVNNCKRK